MIFGLTTKGFIVLASIAYLFLFGFLLYHQLGNIASFNASAIAETDFSTNGNNKGQKTKVSNKTALTPPHPQTIKTTLPSFNQNLYKFRNIPDTRVKECVRNWDSVKNFPTVSVVICFRAETQHHIQMTVLSVLNRTPPDILQEIVLVNDGNNFDVWENITSLPRVKVVKNAQVEGLIRARVIGADASTGEVIVFLDAHCEANVDWIQPLLWEIMKNETTVAVPVIDILEQGSEAYKGAPCNRGGIRYPGWSFDWIGTKSDYQTGDTYETPTMAGGLLAISRKWFEKSGKYDMGMRVWGFENVEMSLRIWMCGGRVVTCPCSRVGHLFRSSAPYSMGDAVTENLMRMAYVWLDQYKDGVINQISANIRNRTAGLAERVALRNELKCQSLDWYIDNVYPEFRAKVGHS